MNRSVFSRLLAAIIVSVILAAIFDRVGHLDSRGSTFPWGLNVLNKLNVCFGGRLFVWGAPAR
jgi:hypothetical protein